MSRLEQNMIIQISYNNFWIEKIKNLVIAYNRMNENNEIKIQQIIMKLEHKESDYYIITYNNLLKKFNEFVKNEKEKMTNEKIS